MFWRFLGILGGSKNRQKTREIRQKITGRERRSSGTVFGQFLKHFFATFKAQSTVKYSVFAIFALKNNNVKCCKNTVNTDVFEGPCAENTVNTLVFGATFLRFLAQKYRYLRCFLIPKCRKLRKQHGFRAFLDLWKSTTTGIYRVL